MLPASRAFAQQGGIRGPGKADPTGRARGHVGCSTGVTRVGMALALVAAVGAGCRGPSPLPDLDRAVSAERQERVARIGEALLPGAGVRWDLSRREEFGAWAWPEGRIAVSPALVDHLDDDALAAALAHELGHLLDGGHLRATPHALDGAGEDVERRADRIACCLLARRGVPGEAMARMLATVARLTRDPRGELAVRRRATADCAPAGAVS